MTGNRPRTLLPATIALWTVAFVAWTADALLEPVPFALERAFRRLPLCVFGVLLCMGLARIIDGLRGRNRARVGVITALGVMLASVLYALANEIVMFLIAPHWGPSQWIHVPDVAMLVLWVFTAWALLYFALDADAQRRDREVRLAQTSAAAIDAQHRLLLQQIKPHFLFNALNTVYALVLDNDNERARRSLLALSAFLRTSLDNDAPMQVSFACELQSLRNYLDIELVRFGDRLRLHEDIPDALLQKSIPHLILQPLVENCIKHGLTGSLDVVTIRLVGASEANGWVLSIEDDGCAYGDATPVTYGVGLGNVARRLHLLYGDAARLEAHALANHGFVARIHLDEPE